MTATGGIITAVINDDCGPDFAVRSILWKDVMSEGLFGSRSDVR